MSLDPDASIRASALWELLDCAHRYNAKQHQQLPASVPAAIGTAVHASTAAFDQAVLDKNYISADDAAEVAVDLLAHPREEVDWVHSDVTHKEAESIALWCHTSYCADISPTRRYLTVEEELKPLVVRLDTGIRLELTGHLDRRRVAYGPQGEEWQGVSDIKTGAQAVGRDGGARVGRHGPQLGVYELLAEHNTGKPLVLEPEIIGLQTAGARRVGVAGIPNARRALVGTEEHPGFLDFVGDFFRLGRFPPNPGSLLCSPKYCPAWDTCPYHD